jgi:hypothetical protein
MMPQGKCWLKDNRQGRRRRTGHRSIYSPGENRIVHTLFNPHVCALIQKTQATSSHPIPPSGGGSSTFSSCGGASKSMTRSLLWSVGALDFPFSANCPSPMVLSIWTCRDSDISSRLASSSAPRINLLAQYKRRAWVPP